jgi:hypothetical protein
MDDAVLLQPASSQYKVEAQARGHQEVCFLNQSCYGELEVACVLDLHLLPFPGQQDMAVGVCAQGDVVAKDAGVSEVLRSSGVDQGWDLAAVDDYRGRAVGGSRVACRGYFYQRRRSSTAETVEFSGFVLALGQSLCQCRPGQNGHRGSWGASLGCLS